MVEGEHPVAQRFVRRLEPDDPSRNLQEVSVRQFRIHCRDPFQQSQRPSRRDTGERAAGKSEIPAPSSAPRST